MEDMLAPASTVDDQNTDLENSGDQGKQGSLAEVAYNSVFKMILGRELAGGTVIQERKLADSLGISRTPMREALKRLEGEGWLVRLTDRLLSVKLVSLEEYLQALGARRMLEAGAIELAAKRMSDEKIEHLQSQIDQLKVHPDPSYDMHWDFDDSLHGGIADASGNLIVARLIRELRHITHLFETQTVPPRLLPGIAEHEAIIDALRKRDPVLARECILVHLEGVRDGVMDGL